MVSVPEAWFEGSQAKALQLLREKARARHNIIYDCVHAYLADSPGGLVVYCRKGHFDSRLPGSTNSFANVLKGRGPRICHACPDFEEGDAPDNGTLLVKKRRPRDG